MTSLFVLIPMGVVFAAIAVFFFVGAVNGRQFEGLRELERRMPDDEDA